MKRTINLFKHILRLTLKKKGNFVTILLLPLLGVLAALVFNTNSVSVTTVAVYNQSNSIYVNDIISDLKSNDNFNVKVINSFNKNETKSLGYGNVLIFPDNFDKEVINGNLKGIELYSKSNDNTSIWLKSYLNYYLSNINSIAKISSTENDFAKLYTNFRENRTTLVTDKVKDMSSGKAVTKSSIGFLLVFMLMASKIATDFIINDKRRKTYTRIFASPVTKTQYLMANVMVNLLLFFVQIAVIIFTSTVIFKLNFFIPVGYLIILFGFFGLVAISFGMFIAAISKSTTQASQLANILIVPTSMLAGCFWPSELMPMYLQKLSLLMPQSWVLKAVDSLQHGGSLMNVLPYLGILALFFVSIFSLASFIMSKGKDTASFI